MPKSRYKIVDDAPYFLTFTVNDWTPVFRLPDAAQIALNALSGARDAGVKLYAFVVMEDHIHCVMQADGLPEKIRKLKGRAARTLIDMLERRDDRALLARLASAKRPFRKNSAHQFWSEGSHAQRVMDVKMMRQKIAYIHNNPVKRGYVERAEDWRYSSAANYAGMDGAIAVDTDWG